MGDDAVSFLLTNAGIAGVPEADALAVADGRIAAIGSLAAVAAACPTNVRVDLGGGYVLPGFTDAHTHVFSVGLAESGYTVDLANRSRSETLDLLREMARSRGAGEWIVGVGWDESRWDDRRRLTCGELDALAPESPMIAVRLDGHLLTANREALAAFERLGRADREGVVDREDGTLREEAAWALIESIEPDGTTLGEALTAAARLCHRLGITSIHAMTRRARVPVLLDHAGKERLRIRFYCKVGSVQDVAGLAALRDLSEEWIAFGGVKAFADGSIGAGNAAVSVPFLDGGTGALNFSDAQLREIVAAADKAKLQTAVHAIGDRAIDQVLRIHRDIGTARENRHRIEHFELPQERQVADAGALGLWLSMQPNFTANWSGPDSLYDRRMGKARDQVTNPLRWIAEADVPLAFGSDGMPMSALYGLHAAVNPPYDAQRLSIEDALAAYTSGGPRLAGQDDAGTISVGALADLVVLDADPSCAPSRIRERSVVRTYVGGTCVYAAGCA